MQVAAAMEFPAVLFIPGYVGLPWDPTVKPVRYDLAYDRTREALAGIGPRRRAVGRLDAGREHLEQVPPQPLEMPSLVDQVGSPSVGALLDIGNLIAFGYPEQWVRILGKRIREVHVKDYRQCRGNGSRSRRPLGGRRGLAGSRGLLARDRL